MIQTSSYQKSGPSLSAPVVIRKTDDSKVLKRLRSSWIAGLPAHVGVDVPEKIPTFLAIGGGKGGVGKSILSSNLAAVLGQAGFNVLLVDLDIGGANLHTYFGIRTPKNTLADFVLSGNGSFQSLVLKTPIERVVLAPGGKDESWSDAADFGSGAFVSLWDALFNSKNTMNIDFVILDLGAGTHRHTIDFFTAAHLGMITVLPEPTSIENAYSFLKATMWRLIENAGMHVNSCACADEVKELLFSNSSSLSGSYIEKLMHLRPKYAPLIDHILLALKGRFVGFAVNQIRSQKDIDIGRSMETICKNYFGYETKSIGYLNYDDAAWKSLRNKRLLVLDFPHSILARRVSIVTQNVLHCLGF